MPLHLAMSDPAATVSRTKATMIALTTMRTIAVYDIKEEIRQEEEDDVGEFAATIEPQDDDDDDDCRSTKIRRHRRRRLRLNNISSNCSSCSCSFDSGLASATYMCGMNDNGDNGTGRDFDRDVVDRVPLHPWQHHHQQAFFMVRDSIFKQQYQQQQQQAAPPGSYSVPSLLLPSSPAIATSTTSTTTTAWRRRTCTRSRVPLLAHLTIILYSCLLGCYCCVNASPATTLSKARITILESTTWTYSALMVDPPTPITDQRFAALLASILSTENQHPVNLMTPPTNYSTLCEFPSELLEYVVGAETNNGDGFDNGISHDMNDVDVDDEHPTSSSESGNEVNSNLIIDSDNIGNDEENKQQDDVAVNDGDSTNSNSNSTSLSNLISFGDSSTPVGLLVSLGGGCDVIQKALVAYQIQQLVSDQIQVVVFYHNDGSIPNVIPSINFDITKRQNTNVDINVDVDIDDVSGNTNIIIDDTTDGSISSSSIVETPSISTILQSIVFLTVSTGTGNAILSTMDRLAAAVGGDASSADTIRPELLGPNNQQEWRLDLMIQKINETRPDTGTETIVVGGEGSSFGDGGNNDDRYPYSSSSSSTDDGDTDYNDSFYWLRFVLFTLLIVAPCIRAGFLWWAGGGRIHFRRDEETGRIIGLIYVPPMIYWFGQHNDDDYFDPVSTCLSEEQVYELPEIVYEHPYEDTKAVTGAERTSIADPLNGMGRQDDDQDEGSNCKEGQDSGEQDEDENSSDVDDTDDYCGVDHGGITVQYGRTDSDDEVGILADVATTLETTENTSTVTINETMNVSDRLTFTDRSKESIVKEEDLGDDDNDGVDEEQPVEQSTFSDVDGSPDNLETTQFHPPPPTPRLFTTTTCTTCSICIDEFENGEKLRLLPRCGHAFHTECILPWLVERQGLCPLCKVYVLSPSQRQALHDRSADEEEATADDEFDDAEDQVENDDNDDEGSNGQGTTPS